MLNDRIEPLETLQEAAPKRGLKVWQLRRAIKRGQLAVYRVSGRRLYVRGSEVDAFIERAREGGGNDL